MKLDEAKLWLRVADGATPRDANSAIGIPRNRLIYLTERKWTRNRIYEYGVTCDLGWMVSGSLADAYTDRAKNAVRGES